MILDWPIDLPRPERSNWQLTPQEARRKTQSDAGPPRYRRRFSSVARIVSLSLILTRDGKAVFDRFFHEDCAEGSYRGIFQGPGCGTTQICNGHCWPGPDDPVYTRTVSGSAPVTLDFRLSNLDGVAYDNNRVSISLDAAGYLVITPRLNLTAPGTVTAARDLVLIEMQGWGSDFTACYVDLHKVRLWGDGHRFRGFFGIPPRHVSNRDCVFELVPQSDEQALRSLMLDGYRHKNLPVRTKQFPNPSNPGWSFDAIPEALAAYNAFIGQGAAAIVAAEDEVALRVATRDSGRAMISIARKGQSGGTDRHQIGTDGKRLIMDVDGETQYAVTATGLQLRSYQTRPNWLDAVDAGTVAYDATAKKLIFWDSDVWQEMPS